HASLDAYYPVFFFTRPPPTAPYTLSLHDALPIWSAPTAAPGTQGQWLTGSAAWSSTASCSSAAQAKLKAARESPWLSAMSARRLDRKSTRLNSSHVAISYAVFCLKKKKKTKSNKQ